MCLYFSFFPIVLFSHERKSAQAKTPMLSSGMISTHALREKGDISVKCSLGYIAISTHTLREEGDYS